MHESSHTPPSLCYSPSVSDSRRESTPNTPLTTPTVEQAPWPPAAAQPKREKDLYFSWHRKAGAEKRSSNPLLGSDWHFAHHSEESLFEDDGDGDGDISFPLFPESPPRFKTTTMASAAPIDISLPPRMSSNSQSPRNQTSNLTFALQEAGATGQPAPEAYNGRSLAIPEAGRLSVSGRQDSMSNIFGSSYYNGTGAKPISVKDRNRRESNTAGSFMNGMSWGGISVGSWVRDE
jgi:transcription factor SFP1